MNRISSARTKRFSKGPPLEPVTTPIQVGIFSFSSKYLKYIDIFHRRGQIIFNPNLFRKEKSIYVYRSAPTKNRYSTSYLPTFPPVLSPGKIFWVFFFHTNLSSLLLKSLFHVLLPFYFLSCLPLLYLMVFSFHNIYEVGGKKCGYCRI